MKLAFHQDVRNLIVEAHWQVNEVVRNHFEERMGEAWPGTYIEGTLTLRPFRGLQDFLKNSYNSNRILLQSQNSVVQLAQRLIRTLSIGVENVFRIVWWWRQ